MVQRFFVSALFSVALITARHAHGDEVDDLIDKGVELRREHRNGEALECFRKAHALKPSPRTQAQIGLAQQALGHWLQAEQELVTALASSGDPWIVQHEAALETSLEAVRDRLGWLDITSNVTPADLVVDGAVVGQLPLLAPLRLASGTAVIEVRAAGFMTVKRAVFIHPRVTAREEVRLVRADAPAPMVSAPLHAPTAASPEAPARRIEPLPLILVGLGTVSMGVGTYFGVRTFVLKGRRDDHCDSGTCDGDGLALHAEAKSAATLSTITLGAGVASIVLGVLVWPKSKEQKQVIAVQPWVGGVYGLMAGATF